MGNPLNVAVKLVSAITARVKDVKTNQEGCKLLEESAKKTLAILQQMENTQFYPSLETALQPVHDALVEAQEAIDKCCDTNFFYAMLYSKKYESALKHAATKLQHALFQIPLVSHRMDSDLKSDLFDLSCQLHHSKFEERAAMAHQAIELKETFEQAFFNARIVNEELRQKIRMLVERHVASAELQAQTALLIKDLAEARKNKESQMEFELSQIIEVMAESLNTTSKTPKNSQDLESSFLCPISKDIMRDPVILVETGTTYDRSSILEWFSRGHGHDPLTNTKLASKELVPDHMLQDACLTFLGEPTSSSSAYMPPIEMHASPFEPGLYEGHGRLVFSSSTILVLQTLILKPQGEVNGYAIYKKEMARVVKSKLESGDGKWDAKNLKLSYTDNEYIFNGSVNHTIIEGGSMVRWNGKVITRIGNIEDGEFDIVCWHPCVSLNIWPRPGMYQMENAYITFSENINYMATLLLSFQVDSRVEGYMWINMGQSLSKYVGIITNGRWKSKESVEFSVYFPFQSNPLDSQTMPINWLFTLEIEGNFTKDKDTPYSFFNAKITKKLNKEIEPRDKTYFTLFDDIECLKFPCIREASIPWHHIHQDPFRLFQSARSYDLTSKNEAVSTKIDVNYGVLSYNLNAWRRTSLHLASQLNYFNVIKKNIVDNANLNIQDKNGASPLYKGSQRNAINVVKILLAHGADMKLLSNNGWSPLHIASQSNSIHVVKELIAHGACIDLQGNDGCTPLHVASQTNCINVVKELIANGANIDVCEKSGWTPLLIASLNNSVDVVQELITHGANVNFRANKGKFPLYIASQNNYVNVVKELIAHGANINLQDNDGTSSLHVASSCDSIDIVKELIANNASIDLRNNNGWTSLHFAVYEKFDDIVKILLANGASINCQENNGRTPLHYASQMNSVDIVKTLIANGAIIDLQDHNGLNPVHVASRENSLDVVKASAYLIDDDLYLVKELIVHGVNINCTTNDGCTPLHLASKTNSLDVVKELLVYDVATIDLQAINGTSPLHIACACNSINVVKELLRYGANFHLQENDGQTPLHLATQINSIDIARELIASHVYINFTDNNVRHPLHIAAENNSIDVAKELISHGAKIDLQAKNGATPLYVAIQHNSIDVAKELIAHGANINLQNKNGWTPLHIASQKNLIVIVKELIAHGANINLQNKNGASPLYIASEMNSIDVAKELIVHGTNIDLQNKNGASPLYIASEMNSIDVAKELIAHGANIDLQEKDGWTPLYIAVKKNSIDVAKELIAHGANINLQNKNGWTPLHIAAACSHVAIVKLLLQHGASKRIRNNEGKFARNVVRSMFTFDSHARSVVQELKRLLR